VKKYEVDAVRWAVKAKIEEIEVERTSESSVWVKGRRRAKVTDWHLIFDTWEAAHAYLMTEGERKVLEARRALESANSALGNVKGMKKPVIED
jgi:hypothetical protein